MLCRFSAKLTSSLVTASPQSSAPKVSHVPAWRLFSSDIPSPEARANAEKLLDMMASTPAMQQMMLASLPSSLTAGARIPEVLKQVLSDPRMREQMISMIAKQNIQLPPQALNNMSSRHMEETFARAKRLGLDPARVFQKLVSHPEIFKKLQQPHVLRAFLEVSQNPSAVSKYDEDTIEVVRKVRDILERPTDDSRATQMDASVVHETSSSTIPPPPQQLGGTPSESPPEQQIHHPVASTTTMDAEFKPSTSGPAPDAMSSPQAGLLAALEQHPVIGPKLLDPNIRKAVEEVARSPWKTVKYVFNREVMEVFSEMNKLLKGRK